ncbi:restriction endonuclease subunit S [Ruegeria arenilitoris]|uniref:restriction endonuclease subunit S n=1 Tax=Ruegeria arenilitoris TaxID=1173585 RepID=UPI001480CEE6
MKLGWKEAKLGELIELISGQHIAAKDYNAAGIGFPYLTGPSDFTDLHPQVSRWTEHPKKMAQLGDILFTVKGSGVGKVNVLDIPEAVISRQIMAVRARDIDSRFLFLLLKQLGGHFQEISNGAAIPGLSRGDLNSVELHLPPLEEQKRIVAVLDEAFAALDRARTHAEANLKNARELFERERETQLALNDATWTDTKVGSLCLKMEYGTAEKSLPTGEVPVLRMGNLQDGELDWTKLVYSNNQNDISKLLLKDGDVLFNRTNSAEHVGKTAIFRGKREAIFAGYLIRLHLKSELVNPEFMNIFLNSKIARDYGKSVMGKSVNQANISGLKLKQYPIQLPPLTKQVDIVDRLLALKAQSAALQQIYQKKLLDIEDLRQSLLQKAFSGELT